MNIRPLKDRLVVRRFESPSVHGVIFLPESAREQCNVGEVVAVGPKVDGVFPGDTVYFGPFVDFESEGLVLIQEGDIRVVMQNA